MKRYFTLYSGTFLWVNDNVGLLYSTDTFLSYEFELTVAKRRLCNRLLDYSNLYTVPVDKLKQEILHFIDMATILCFGYVWSDSDVRKISLPPILNLQCDIDRLQDDDFLHTGLEANTYLSTLNIYMGGETDNDDYFRQVLYPPECSERLSLHHLDALLGDGTIRFVRQLNIVFGIGIGREYIEEVCRLVKQHELTERVRFQLLAEDIDTAETLRCSISSAITYIVRCGSMGSLDVRRAGAESRFRFLVTAEADLQAMEPVWQQIDEGRYTVEPVFNANLRFFTDRVLLGREDLTELQLSKREVFAHMSVNVDAFGTLTVMPDGLVYSDISSPPVGKVGEPLQEAVYRELVQNYSWRQVRSSEPCISCVYRWLCPSPTTYEKAMGRTTACSIYEQ